MGRDLETSLERGTFVRDLWPLQMIARCKARDDTIGFRFLIQVPQGSSILRHGHQAGAWIVYHELIEPIIVSADGLINSDDAGDWHRVPSVPSN